MSCSPSPSARRRGSTGRWPVDPDPGWPAAFAREAERIRGALGEKALAVEQWEEHRMLKGTGPEVNLHVFSPRSAEVDRMLRFRDRLRADVADRERYAAEKRTLAAREWEYVQDYADAKSGVVEQILARS